MLISVGAYSTIIVFIKFIFALIYHVYEYTSKSWLRVFLYFILEIILSLKIKIKNIIVTC